MRVEREVVEEVARDIYVELTRVSRLAARVSTTVVVDALIEAHAESRGDSGKRGKAAAKKLKQAFNEMQQRRGQYDGQ